MISSAAAGFLRPSLVFLLGGLALSTSSHLHELTQAKRSAAAGFLCLSLVFLLDSLALSTSSHLRRGLVCVDHIDKWTWARELVIFAATFLLAYMTLKKRLKVVRLSFLDAARSFSFACK